MPARFLAPTLGPARSRSRSTVSTRHVSPGSRPSGTGPLPRLEGLPGRSVHMSAAIAAGASGVQARRRRPGRGAVPPPARASHYLLSSGPQRLAALVHQVAPGAGRPEAWSTGTASGKCAGQLTLGGSATEAGPASVKHRPVRLPTELAAPSSNGRGPCPVRGGSRQWRGGPGSARRAAGQSRAGRCRRSRPPAAG